MTKIILDLSKPRNPQFTSENVNAEKIYQATLDAITMMCSVIEQIIIDEEIVERIKMSRMAEIQQWTKLVTETKSKLVKK